LAARSSPAGMSFELSTSDWDVGDGKISTPSDCADSTIALFFLRPGQVGIIMLAIESVSVQLSQRSVEVEAGGAGPSGGMILVLHPQPGKHDFAAGTGGLPITDSCAAGAPGGSKGGLPAQDSFMKQTVEVVRVEVTVVLVT